jgi:NADH-quinone oxidoreductase subunit G
MPDAPPTNATPPPSTPGLTGSVSPTGSDISPKQPAPPPDTVSITVDGQPVSVPKGTNVIEAARLLGIDISAFCYHPGLPVVAVCRQCLVSVEGNPKLQPSCQQMVTEGMVVKTTDPQSTLARKQMLEFTLLNHPVDCPICDKAGECTLQKLYFEHDNERSRVDVPKVNKPKAVDLGPEIVLDAERCILCTRCIRVCDEVAGVHQLEMNQRGDHEELGTAPGAVLDNPYSLNTVDVCPVGALTAKDFRFTMRAWELSATPSVCPGCATGCNVEIHHHQGRTWRLVPRHNPDVNAYWMCDEGRFTYHDLNRDRLAAPLVGGLPARWDTALAEIRARLAPLFASRPAAIGVVLSPAHSNEDNYALLRLCRDIWGLTRFYVGGRRPVPERADKILRDADVTANRRGVQALEPRARDLAALEADLLAGEVGGLIILGHDLPISPEAIGRAADLSALIAIADHEAGLVRSAHVALPSAAWTEVAGTVTNRQGRVQRLHAAYPPPGDAAPAWQIVTRLAQASDAALGWDHVRKVFLEMVEKVPDFKGAEWGREARPVQLRFANSRG